MYHIDEKIKSYVLMFNKLCIPTLSSCQGLNSLDELYSSTHSAYARIQFDCCLSDKIIFKIKSYNDVMSYKETNDIYVRLYDLGSTPFKELQDLSMSKLSFLVSLDATSKYSIAKDTQTSVTTLMWLRQERNEQVRDIAFKNLETRIPEIVQRNNIFYKKIAELLDFIQTL